jgi:phenylpropionate dioxygenase-like ring-hydroxylating dioxygenase large terminal subunit
MFEGFAGVWTPIVPARSLGKKPLATRLAGEPVVLFRGAAGVGALIDRCPHRGVALSLGQIDESGCLECPFHGWKFAPGGACVRIPLNEMPAEKRERYAATALPVREIGGLIWVFTGTDSAGTEPDVPEALVASGWSRWIHDEVWSAHWTRAMENMLDTPHVPFVHRRTIGRGMRARMRPDSVLRMTVEPEPYGARFVAALDGVVVEGGGLRWRRPNGMELHIPIPGKKMRLQIFCVPIDALHTRMIIIASRDFMRWGPFAWLSDQFNRYIVFEDRAIVQSSQPPEVPPPGDELSIASDGPTLHFRRYYYRELRPSGGAALVPASALSRG